MTGTPATELSNHDYRTLAEFRYLIRQFLEFSEAAARRAGLTAQQHQALLAIKGFPAPEPPTVGDLAERLCVQHHSAVGLVNRLEAAGLLARSHAGTDRRQVFLTLTAAAEEQLSALPAIHLQELARLRPMLTGLLDRIARD